MQFWRFEGVVPHPVKTTEKQTEKHPMGWACWIRFGIEYQCCIAVMLSFTTQWDMAMSLPAGKERPSISVNWYHRLISQLRSEENIACLGKSFNLEIEVDKKRKLRLSTKNSLWLFQIYKWMTQIQESNSELVTQHHLGKTIENRTIYYLQVRQELY